jgi:Zn-dependent protease with chaperone function
MYRTPQRPLLTALLTFALLAGFAAPLSALAQNKEEKKEEKKEAKKEEKKEEKPKLTKQEKKYQEIKRFSAELYQKDADFRDTVDDAYERKMQEHAKYAFDINTRNGLDGQIRRDGDKLNIYDALYDNPLAQDYVNRLGQSLVPAGTSKLYAFKITLNPIPEAKSLATGTIYVSTGLLSKVDNEAQLAYILGHEIGHVEKEHWFEDTLVSNGIPEYNEKQQKKRAMWGAIIGAATAGVAGAAGVDALNAGLMTGLVIAPTLLKFVIPNAVNSWDRLQEDEADQLGLKYMLERSYDPREVPKFYASMQRTTRDKRAGLGFMADPQRMNERIATVNLVLAGLTLDPNRLLVGAMNLADARPSAPPPSDNPTKSLNPSVNSAARAAAADRAIGTQLSADIKQKLEAGELVGSSAEFEAVMAALKRDNGIRAFYYDMFQMARDNLEESLLIRSNDPFTHFYYGKVLKLTARNAAEKSRALAEFVRAIDLDKRRVLPEARLHRALALIENKESSQLPDIVTTLKEYVSLYQRQNGGHLPPNMDAIYDYMQEAGELTWSAPPVTNISTKNIEPIGVAAPAAARPAGGAPADPAASGRRP